MNSDNELHEAKKALRREILMIRDRIPENERRRKSEEIYRYLCDNEAFINASTIFFFAGYASEVRTDFMIEDTLKKGKTVAVPKVVSESEIEFFRIRSVNDLTAGYKGIPEPVSGTEKISAAPGLLIMPGVVFDLERNRIGYGKGYYDRYLAGLEGQLKTIAICFDEQIREKIPSEKNDIKPDLLISDKRLIRG